MPRLFVHVEGPTEESFVNEVLSRHFFARGFHAINAKFIGGPRRRGGICGWPEARKGIVNHLRQDGSLFVTTMVDFYGLPQDEGREWPGRRASGLHAIGDRAGFIETQMSNDVRAILDTERFIPFVVMHEFEALLFSDCAALSRGIYRPDIEAHLFAIREQFPNPEEIDDSPDSAPSKRILALEPHYQKPVMGTLAALEIGLEKIRAECPHFDGWVRRLEALA